ncbi:MAG: haloacid dehalogenase-like hydrolase [Phycisphaeraceae bacterium]|nr:MAG: haloacid dehalogenase-like hydrolase [Phycisphaeraceae bacterium]
MLILFDIDATLITTQRAGIEALHGAGQDHFGPGFTTEGVDFAGRLDPLILADLLVRNALEPTPANRGVLRDGYRRRLASILAEPGRANACPGVMDLLAALAGRPGVTLGLLTGNFPDTGALKLRAAGIEPEGFPVRVWGDESPHDPPAREHLVPVGLERYATLAGSPADPARVTVIGDTPHDVACARAHGCRSLAVATGMYSRLDLERAGATAAVENLSSTGEVLGWLLD